jgi:C-terminal processing protease CtpA/Prc
MTKSILSILIILLCLTISCQTKNKGSNLNFDFEQVEKGLPIDWNNFGGSDYVIGIDSTIFQNGRFSAFIEFNGEKPDFKAWEFKIPDNYNGEKITLSGYIKTENVSDGYAGLWMRIDPAIAFDNMNSNGITGTTDWKKYEITLDMNPEKTKQIVFGGLLVGKGKMWLDNLAISIDGKNIDSLQPVAKKVYLARSDREFDQGSSIVLSEISPTKLENLELLGKVWGFLKYHHPKIANGEYNWDYQLFRFLLKYLQVKDKAGRDKILVGWIDSLGKIPACKKCEPTREDAYLKPDLTWIENLDKILRDKLFHVYKNRSQGNHYYIEMAPGAGNPEFINENSYQEMLYPDDGFRLLALYRYWNIINYFFPYKHLIDGDWNSILKEYINVFIDAKNDLEYQLAVLQLIGEIQDSHAILNGAHKLDEWKGKYYPPFQVRFVEDKLVVTDFFNPDLKKDSGFEIGDIIEKINGKSIEDIVKQRINYYPASNLPRKLRNMSVDILRSSSEEIEIEFLGKNSSRQLKKLKLYPQSSLKMAEWLRNKSPEPYKLLDNNIGYITLETIKDQDITVIVEQFEKTRGIIIDIRNYPSAFVPFSLGSFFVSSPTPFVKLTQGNIDNPGEFNFSQEIVIPNGEKTYNGKLVVLVNEQSISQSEYTAMAFRAGANTTILGSTTAGADGNVSDIALPGGLYTLISGIGIYYPDGTETQRIGIVPDLEVKPTIKGVREGKDELLEKAIEIINQN